MGGVYAGHYGMWILHMRVCAYNMLFLIYTGLIVTVLIIEFLGRRKTMAVEFIACMGAFLLLYICTVL